MNCISFSPNGVANFNINDLGNKYAKLQLGRSPIIHI